MLHLYCFNLPFVLFQNNVEVRIGNFVIKGYHAFKVTAIHAWHLHPLFWLHVDIEYTSIHNADECLVWVPELNTFKSDMHEGDTHLPLAYCVPPYFGLAYCVPPFFGLAYCEPFNNKTTIFWRFHLHKEDKMTVCCMHMYNHSCKR